MLYGLLTISTVHRAKGLEWKGVYVPFFNEDFLPTSYKESSMPMHSKCKGHRTDGSCCGHMFAGRRSEENLPRKGVRVNGLFRGVNRLFRVLCSLEGGGDSSSQGRPSPIEAHRY